MYSEFSLSQLNKLQCARRSISSTVSVKSSFMDKTSYKLGLLLSKKVIRKRPKEVENDTRLSWHKFLFSQI